VKRRDLADFSDAELRAALAEPGGRKCLEAALAQLHQQDRRHAEQIRQQRRAAELHAAAAKDRGTMIRRLEAVLGTAERAL
jgi:hypothetical protein